MPNYKLVNADQLDSDLESVAYAIRAKTGRQERLVFPEDFVSAVGSISGGEETIDSLIDGTALRVVSNAPMVRSYAFHESYLEEAILPLATYIGNYAFRYCENLASVDLRSTITIESYAFYGCISLTDLKLPNASSIGTAAFRGCTVLEKVDISSAVNIPGNSFAACEALSTVILRSETMCTMSNASAFSDTPIANGTGYIYVPKNLLSAYVSASNLSTYATQLRAIEDYPEICGSGEIM